VFIVAGFGLGGWDIADRLEKPAVVEPVHPFEGGELHCLGVTPGPAAVDHLGLEQSIDRFGEREVEHGETTTSLSKGKEHSTSRTAKHVRQRTEKAVLASQIMQLADRFGCLRLAGAAEWKKIRFDHVEFQSGTEPYVPVAPRREAAE